MSEETKAGAIDDDAKKRLKERKKKTQDALDAIFKDNTSGRYSGPTDK